MCQKGTKDVSSAGTRNQKDIYYKSGKNRVSSYGYNLLQEYDDVKRGLDPGIGDGSEESRGSKESRGSGRAEGAVEQRER